MTAGQSGMKVQVACPAYTVTGGPEALHQLVHTGRQLGFDLRMVYLSKKRGLDASPTAEPFRVYDIRIDEQIEDRADVLLLVPETNTELLNGYRSIRKAIWWLSIDNYWVAARGVQEQRRRWWKRRPPLPFSFDQPDPSILHLAQSEYARSFLQGRRVNRVFMLTDHLRDDFLQQVHGDDAPRLPRIAYNPRKGLDVTSRITERAAGRQLEFVRIENLTPRQVMELLRTSAVYMDFGHHPGRDRIPREAAACGCCIVTGRRGSAANPVDLPIPQAFKLDEDSPSFVDDAIAVLERLTRNYEAETVAFDPYRKIIVDQKRLFEQEVKDFLTTVLQTPG